MAKNKDYEERVYAAVEIYNDKKFSEAKKKFIELASINPKNIKVHEVLCQIYTNENKFEKAEEEYEILCNLMRDKGIEIPPRKTFEEIVESLESEDVLEERYQTYLEKGGQEALREASSAVQLAIYCMSKGEYKRAEELIQNFKNNCSV